MKTPYIALAALAAVMPVAAKAQDTNPAVDMSGSSEKKEPGFSVSVDEITSGVATDGRKFARTSINVSGTGEPLLDYALGIGLTRIAIIGQNFQNDPFNDINTSTLADVGPVDVLLSGRSTMDSTNMRTRDDALFDPADLIGAGKAFNVGGQNIVAGAGLGIKDGDVSPMAIVRNDMNAENKLRKLNWQMTASSQGASVEGRIDLTKNMGTSAFASTDYGLGARVHGRMNITQAFNAGAQLSYTMRYGASVGAQLNYQRGDTRIGLGVEIGKGVHDRGNASGFLTLTQNISGLRKNF